MFLISACHFFLFIFGRNLGTVGAVALDCKGNVAYATSTGGIINKMVGRVGDTPCIGSLDGWQLPPLFFPSSSSHSLFSTLLLFLHFLPLGGSIRISGSGGWVGRGYFGHCFERAFVSSRHSVFPRLHVFWDDLGEGKWRWRTPRLSPRTHSASLCSLAPVPESADLFPKG